MRVAFESTALLGRPTGVGVFARSVLAELARRPDLDLTAFSLTWRGRGGLATVVPRDVAVVTRPIPARPARWLWKRMDWPRIDAWTGPVDVVHGPNYVVPPTRAARVVSVHDLTTVRFPELCTRDTLDFPALVQRAIDGGAWVHTDSEFVADEVRSHFEVAVDKVVAIHLGVPDLPESEPGAGGRLAGGERYVVAVGTIEPRKDLARLVEAFDEVAADDDELRLVIAGPDGWGTEQVADAIDRARHSSRIVRTGWVSDDERAALVRDAIALVHAARYEGFGFPPLEAMTAGVPVVATGAGAVTEVVGDAGLVVAPEDTAAMAAALARIVDDGELRATLVRRGSERAAQFSWARCADQLADLYQRAVTDSSQR
jgi:glycosyltransferase involved in cell wall biosynthesis